MSVSYDQWRSIIDGTEYYVMPDSVVHQYPVSTFTTSTWADNAGSADMSVNGMTADTFANGEESVLGQTDDYGLADGPQSLPNNQDFGVAMTLQYSDVNDLELWAGSSDGSNDFRIHTSDVDTGSVGGIGMQLGDNNSNRNRIQTDATFDDGAVHAVVINKIGNTATDWNIYVDDMGDGSDKSTTTNDQGFDHTNYSNTVSMGFYDNNENGTLKSRNIDSHVGVFEFKSSTYSQTEREDFVSRRPEV